MKLALWLQAKGQQLLMFGREMRKSERGEIDIGGILIMGIGMVFLAVGFIMYPIIMTATDALLDWVCVANTSTTDASFTGFTEIVGITPLLVLIGYLSAAVFSMYLGIKIMKAGEGGTTLNLGTMLLLGISLIFIAIGLIILPVALEAICSVLSNNTGAADTGVGLSTAYVGLQPILTVTPLLLLISFVSGAVISGFFGLKRIGSE